MRLPGTPSLLFLGCLFVAEVAGLLACAPATTQPAPATHAPPQRATAGPQAPATQRTPGAEPSPAATPIPAAPAFRPPAVPLVVHDPYFSIWSAADRLTDAWPVHWTGRPHAMSALLRVERPGAPPRCLRLMGPGPADVPALPQTSVTVRPTTTVYTFADRELAVTLTFCSPLLPHDLDLLARPATYVTADVAVTGGAPADVTLRLDLVAEVAVNDVAQPVVWPAEAPLAGGLLVARLGTEEQPVLAKQGDDLRIDWGWAWLATPPADGSVLVVRPADRARRAFARGEPEPAIEDAGPRPVRDEWPALTASIPMRGVGAQGRSAWAVIAYDDEWSVQYFDERLRPYWRRDGLDARGMLARAAAEREATLAAAAAFDAALDADLRRLGGAAYAQLAALAYRQAVGGNKLAADAAGKPLLFSKENFSNGCIGTVDVIYPMAPLFLALSPDLARAMLVPVLDYGRSARWRFPFAPHDLGTYPHATGQVYGGGEATAENQMPVEESANLILLVAALERVDGAADILDKYWAALTQWAGYLRSQGYDPANQLCTDDFTGHLAHNVNLSAKAVLAMGAYARLLDRRGDTAAAADWRALARDLAARWVREASDGGASDGIAAAGIASAGIAAGGDASAGEATKLAFDRPGTWSQKYNLVWDDVLDLELFPPEVKRREVAFYRKVQAPFGLPLDSRAAFTKTDWVHWSALLSGERDDFEALIRPLHRAAHETPDRVPLSDWVQTTEPRKVGFQARPVVGGFFMPMLADRETWQRWSAAGSAKAGPVTGWAPLPLPVGH